jgi:hypothetical protein
VSVTLVNPLDETPRGDAKVAPRLDSIQGKKIGLLDISKPGGRPFLNRIESLLKEKYGAAEIVRFQKPTFTKPAPPEIVDRILKAQVQGVIEALAD